MFKRLKNIWKLSRMPESSLTDEHIALLKEELRKDDMLQGDGKAEFLGEGTVLEFEEQQQRDKGIFGLFGTRQK